MPVWLERLVLRNAGIEYVPVLVCVGLAVAAWWWQWSRRAKRPARERGAAGGSLRVGWGPGVAVVSLVVLAVAAVVVMTGVGPEVWSLIEDEPWLAAWWLVGIGVAIALWGLAVHAWRGEGRLARQCKCGYDMTAVAGMRCPECGREARNERQLRRFNVRRGALWLAAVIVVVGLLTPTAMTVRQRGWAAALPSRMLLWWISATAAAPDNVLLEVRYRCGQEPDWWRAHVAERSGELTDRMMECGPGRAGEYARLLTEVQSLDAERVAMNNINSPDPARRRNAAALLAAMRRPRQPLPLAFIEELLADPDPTVQGNGRALVPGAVDEILDRLNGLDGKPAETDPVRVRTLVRLMSDPQPYYYSTRFELLNTACASTDAEAAACASILRARWAMMVGRHDAATLRAAIIGEQTLQRLKAQQVTLGMNVMAWFAMPDARESLVPLLADPDLAVRLAFLAELDKGLAPYAAYFQTRVDQTWIPVRELLESRLAQETDPEAIRLLQSAVNALRGKPSAQP